VILTVFVKLWLSGYLGSLMYIETTFSIFSS